MQAIHPTLHSILVPILDGGYERVGTSLTPPVNLVPPVVTGTGYIGYALSSTNGSWSGSPTPTFTYQWQRFTGGTWNNIGSATNPTYVVTLADEGVPVRCVVTATNGSGSASANSNAVEQWVPTDLGASLENWWDAEDASTVTLATGVSAWAGRGGLAETVSQGTAAQQPAYSATGWDGSRPALVFDGTDDRLRRDASADRCRNQPGYRIASLVRLSSYALSDNRIANVMSGVTNNSRLIVGCNATLFNMGARRLDASTFFFVTPSNFPNDTADHVRMALFKFDVGEAQQRIDGVLGSAVGLDGPGNTSDTASLAMFIGAGSSSNAIGMALHEILFIRGNGTVAENEKIEAYLAWRGGKSSLLPVGHTWKASAPTP